MAALLDLFPTTSMNKNLTSHPALQPIMIFFMIFRVASFQFFSPLNESPFFSLPFSVYLYSLCHLLQSHSCKYDLKVNDFQILISSLDLSSKI